MYKAPIDPYFLQSKSKQLHILPNHFYNSTTKFGQALCNQVFREFFNEMQKSFFGSKVRQADIKPIEP